MNKKPCFVLCPVMIILLLLCISGCMKPSLPLSYYTLESSNQSAISSTNSESNILIGPVYIASFLDKGQLVKQKSAYSVTIEEQHRWAGNLQEMVSDTLINNLSLDLGCNNVYTFPNNHGVEGLQLELTLLHFEKNTDGQALTQARWKIIDETQAIVHATTSTYTVQPENSSYGSLVKGLSIGLSRLSKDIAETIHNYTASNK